MLNQDFKEFIQLLNDNQVHYLVLGGYAVAIHGHPRGSPVPVVENMELTSITISIPKQLLSQAQSLESETESLNDLMTIALAKEIKQRKAWIAHQTILKIRQEVKEKTGVHPNPIPLIQHLRRGESIDD